MALSRRTFVAWLGGLAASVGLARRTATAAAAPTSAAPDPRSQQAVLDAATLAAVADVVLPSELGRDGLARATRGFTTWLSGHRRGVELVHPYGSATLRTTGESPAARWREQLRDLQVEARTLHRRAFTALSREQRRELVAAALANERREAFPSPGAANHVALALMAWYFGSPEANDLCYRARIGRHSCRPLVNSPREPLPLAPARRPGGDV